MNPEISWESRQVAVCLFVVAAALIVVGIVSDTLPRHLVQVLPLALAFALIPRWRAAATWAAVGVLGVWFAVMAVIWAYLLGLSDIASGTYTNFEVFLTILIAGCSAHGVQKAVQSKQRLPLATGAVAVVGGTAVQAAFLAASIELFG